MAIYELSQQVPGIDPLQKEELGRIAATLDTGNLPEEIQQGWKPSNYFYLGVLDADLPMRLAHCCQLLHNAQMGISDPDDRKWSILLHKAHVIKHLIFDHTEAREWFLSQVQMLRDLRPTKW